MRMDFPPGQVVFAAEEKEVERESEKEKKFGRIWKKGEIVDDVFEVSGLLGQGGMGFVFRVNHRGWKTELAIKSPQPEILADENLKNLYLREAQSWVDLGLHPHIANCYYVKEIEGIPRIILEFVNGGSLHEWIYDKKIYRWQELLGIAIQVGIGLAYAHERGLIHRDLKPPNVLMTLEGTAKLTDFGLVKRWDDKIENAVASATRMVDTQRTTVPGMIMGTPKYMAPEQWQADRAVSIATDVYAYGILLFELICGRIPYELTEEHRQAGMTYRELHLHAPIPNPQRFRNDMPEALADLIVRCMAKEPRHRCQSMDEILERLVAIYQTQIGQPCPYQKTAAVKLKADGLNNHGVSNLDLSNEQKARDAWNEALQADAHHLQANFNYGYWRWQRGEITDDDFVARLRSLGHNYQNDLDYWRCLAWIHLERGDLAALQKLKATQPAQWDHGLETLLEKKDHPVGEFLRAFQTHAGGVYTVCCSHDGRYAASGSDEGTIIIWEIPDGQQFKLLPGHTGRVSSIAFTPDDHHLLSGSFDKTVRLWDIAAGKEAKRWEHTAGICAVGVSPDGQLAMAGFDKTARLWEISSGKTRTQYQGHAGKVTAVGFSPDGGRALSGDAGGMMRIWDIASGKTLRAWNGHSGGVNSLTFSPDGRYVLSGGEDKTLRLWDAAEGKERMKFAGHAAAVNGVCFVAESGEATHALSASSDFSLRFWSLASGQQVRKFDGHQGGVASVCFTSRGHYALSGSLDKSVRLWRTYYPKKNWREVNPYPLLSKIKDVIKLSQEGERSQALLASAKELIAAGSFHQAYPKLRETQKVSGYERNKEIVALINLCGKKAAAKRRGLNDLWNVGTLKGHDAAVQSMSITAPGDYLLSGSWDKTLRLWNLANGLEVRRFDGHEAAVNAVALSPDGDHAISGGWDKTMRLWKITTAAPPQIFYRAAEVIKNVAFSPDGRYVLASSDKMIGLWDFAGGQLLRQLVGHQGIINCATFSPNGRYILSAGADASIRLWNPFDGTVRFRFEGHDDIITIAIFSPDSRYVLSGGLDKNLRLWEVSTGGLKMSIALQNGSPTSAAVSSDSRYALVGSDDHSLSLFDLQTGKEIRRWEGHTDSISCVLFSPDDSYALSGSLDGAIKFWQLDWDWNL